MELHKGIDKHNTILPEWGGARCPTMWNCISGLGPDLTRLVILRSYGCIYEQASVHFKSSTVFFQTIFLEKLRVSFIFQEQTLKGEADYWHNLSLRVRIIKTDSQAHHQAKYYMRVYGVASIYSFHTTHQTLRPVGAHNDRSLLGFYLGPKWAVSLGIFNTIAHCCHRSLIQSARVICITLSTCLSVPDNNYMFGSLQSKLIRHTVSN